MREAESLDTDLCYNTVGFEAARQSRGGGHSLPASLGRGLHVRSSHLWMAGSASSVRR